MSHSYLNFSSPFINQGARSASASSLVQTNDIFVVALISPGSRKAASQDEYGNIKVPMIEYAPAAATDADWIPLGAETLVYSSISGLPYLGVSTTDTTNFTMETTYMNANCTLSHSSPANPAINFTSSNLSDVEQGFIPYYNGENYILAWDEMPTAQYSSPHDYWVRFLSVGGKGWCGWEDLTYATCVISSTYIELAVACTGNDCHSTAIRQSQRPHLPSWMVPLGGSTTYSTLWESFFPNFINSTFSEALCDIRCCGSSLLEAYLLDPDSPGSISSSQTLGGPSIWPIGDRLFSQRFSQLLNTYWINSVAPTALLGNFTIPPPDPSDPNAFEDESGYQVSSTPSLVVVTSEVIRCHRVWLAILFICSLTMIIVGMGGAILNLLRRGPDILDSFVVLLRPMPSVGFARGPTMESVPEQVDRLRNLKVQMGDIDYEHRIGFVAIAPMDPVGLLKPLRHGRRYA